MHATRVEVEYNRDKGLHQWWWECACGQSGPRVISPGIAEREGARHAKKLPEQIEAQDEKRRTAKA